MELLRRFAEKLDAARRAVAGLSRSRRWLWFFGHVW
jgi:hypothetical protein